METQDHLCMWSSVESYKATKHAATWEIETQVNIPEIKHFSVIDLNKKHANSRKVTPGRDTMLRSVLLTDY